LASPFYKGRSFILGNKRAFSLCLPAANGITPALAHTHKWFGAYLADQKVLEGQATYVRSRRNRYLSRRRQTGFTMGLTAARRDYEIDGQACSEEFFVPDGLHAVACTLTGPFSFAVDPAFDLRFSRFLTGNVDGFEIEPRPNGAIVSAPLVGGRFDDRTETFETDGTGEGRLFAAVEVVGEGARVRRRRAARRVYYRVDRRRSRFIGDRAPEGARHDHAPLWSQSEATVFAPIRLYLNGYGTIFYGFGHSREEALHNLEALRDNLDAYRAQKAEGAREVLERVRWDTGSEDVDRAHNQVLTRLIDALVARNAVSGDALDHPATTILAGNQYFHDSWKRDENIALGFLLDVGQYELARDVIRDTWQLQDPETGRLPQRIRSGEELTYHSSDGTLWALHRLYQYWRVTGDDALLYEKMPLIRTFFERSLQRTRDGLLPSGRAETGYLWETWMDTEHTPRDGFPVEIQLLWIAALRAFRPIVARQDVDLEQAMSAAEAAAWSNLTRYNVRGLPADSLDSDGQVRDLITPNPYFCFGLDLDLGPAIERRMREVGRRQLRGRQGIITLAPEDWTRVYTQEFLADRSHVRGRRMRSIGKYNYHRGVEWNWLAQFFVQAELKYGAADRAYRTYLRRQVAAVLRQGGVGGISELFDLSGVRGPEFQAWSMAGFLHALHAFAGVRINVPEQRITVEPQLPTDWPHLRVRKWYRNIPFDLELNGPAISIDFPWDVPDGVTVELILHVPVGQVLHAVDVSINDVPQSPLWTVERSNTGAGERVRLQLPAASAMHLKSELRRQSRRGQILPSAG